MVAFLVWPRLAEFMCEHCVGVQMSTTALHSAVVVLPALLFGSMFILWDSTPAPPKVQPRIATHVNQAKRRRAVSVEVTSIQPRIDERVKPEMVSPAVDPPTSKAESATKIGEAAGTASELKPWLNRPWRIDWKLVIFMGSMHGLSLVGITKLTDCNSRTLLFAAVLYFLSG